MLSMFILVNKIKRLIFKYILFQGILENLWCANILDMIWEMHIRSL